MGKALTVAGAGDTVVNKTVSKSTGWGKHAHWLGEWSKGRLP